MGGYAQTKAHFSYQTKPFKRINTYPDIKDSSTFIRELKDNCHLEVEDGSRKIEKIDHFTKFKIYGSEKSFFLVEFNWHSGCMATYPWKYQVIFDESGKLLKVLHAIRFELVSIFPESPPFLLSVVSTAKGNGQHELYRVKNGNLINTIKYPENFCVRTYDAHEDMTINIPNELILHIEDVNKDGYNDLVFSGNIVLIMAVSNKNVWYDRENDKSTTINYSKDNPFKKIPIKITFFYNPQSGTFYPKGNYTKYCTDNLYKLVYHTR